MDNAIGLNNVRDFYLHIFDDFPNPIWRCGTDAKCNFFNNGWLEFTGRTMEEEAGDGWAAGVHPEDMDGCYKDFIESFNQRKPFMLEYRLRYKDGSYRAILDFGSPYYEGGVFAGYIGSCYDISDRKLAEQAQKIHVQELDERLAEELRLNELLVQQKSKIDELNRDNERVISDLTKSLYMVKMLSGLLPICCACKKIRNNDGEWVRVETYIERYSEAEFTHGLCPDCEKKI